MSQDRRPAGRARGRAARGLAALVLAFGLVGLAAGCGFDAQTSQPYTPADGTNLDVGENNELKIRNLLLISRTDGEGIVSASIVSGSGDQLTGLTITPNPLDGATAAPATATLPAPVELPGGQLVVLTNQQFITVQADGIVAGGAAEVTMQFAQAGQVALNCPVVDGTVAPYSTLTPTPSASPSASPSPSS